MIPCSENIRRTNLPHLRHSFLHKGRDGRLVQLGGLHSPPIIILLTALMNNSVTSTCFWSTWTIADSAQTEYCTTFHCSCVRVSQA